MSLADIVKITISSDSVGVQQAGFGIPLILSPRPTWVERTRSYDSLSDVGVDFATTTPEYKMADAIFAQSPKPEKILIGRAANKPTQRYKISVQTVLNSTKYKVRVGANTAEFTSDANATNDEIVAGLVTAINALTGDGTTASAVGTVGSQQVQLLADAAGNWDAVEVRKANGNLDLLTIVQDHADPGVEADLNAIKTEDNTWYFILHMFNSKAVAAAIAAWAESNEKLFVCASSDTNNTTLADGADSDESVMKSLKTSAYTRTAVIYHPAPDEFADAAWVGKCAPLDPGSETWKFKTLAGVDAVTMTSTHETNVEAKNGNHYQTVAGVNITAEGTVAEGEYIDVIRFRDWLKARMAERIFGHLAAANKIPFTDEGIAVIEGDVRAQLLEGIAVGGLAADPEPVVSVPRASAVSAANKSIRKLPDVRFTATLAGAIHAVEITGVVSV